MRLLTASCSIIKLIWADVVELVDTLALGASAARREGSSPFIRTNHQVAFYFTNLLQLLKHYEFNNPTV